jgi:hypothetical protein
LDSLLEQSAKKGRPGRDDLDIIRCQIWVGELKRRHPSSWREFERLVSKRLGEPPTKNYTSRWNKYARGATTPGLGESAKKLTSIVDSFSPGSEKIYWHPFWQALKKNEATTRAELFSLYAMLPTPLFQSIVVEKPSSRFWRRPPVGIRWKNMLGEGKTIDRLAAALLLFLDAELSQDLVLSSMAAEALERLAVEIPKDEMFERHWPGIVSRLKEILDAGRS